MRLPQPSTVISVIALVMATTGTAVAAVNYASNSGKVDGYDAVGAGSSLSKAAGNVVATASGGSDKGKIPQKFLAIDGGSRGIGNSIPVIDNGTTGALPLAALGDVGKVSMICGDEGPAVGKENPRSTISVVASQPTNAAVRVGTEAPRILFLQPGQAQTFAIGGNNTFRVHLQRLGQNAVLEGVTRQDGAGSGNAACLTYGYVTTIAG